MAFANYFYHGLIRKYVAAFGSLFDQITIERADDSGRQKKMIVPIAYGPWQKTLNKRVQDPKHNNSVAMSLPRMSFEIVGITYDPQRKLASTKKLKVDGGMGVFSPVPYTIEFSLSIMGKYIEDVYKVQEQIIPFFTPEYTPALIVIPGLEALDTPIILNSISVEDSYEGDYETRRAVIGTMTFTMSVEFYSPIRDRKLIKFTDVDINEEQAQIHQWVVDKNDPNKNFKDVEETDDWRIDGIIIEDLEE